MALIDEFRDRYSTQLIVSASNPQNSSATSEDTTRTARAVTDVQSEFKKRGITYDNDVDTHVATAVPGVYARLLVMTGQPGGDDAWKEFKDDLRFLAETTSRDRIMPTTDSLLEPTADTQGDLPHTDRKHFEGYVPNPPGRKTSNT